MPAFLCKLTIYLENMVCMASILIILCVSFERYYAVCYPLQKYSTESRSKAVVLMLLMWLVAAAGNSPFLAIAYTTSVLHYVDQENVTICMNPVDEQWKYGYIIARFIAVFVIPFCLLVFLYSRIIAKVALDTMQSRQMTDRARAQVNRSRQQLVIMLVALVVLFFVCLLPFRIVALYNIHSASEPENLELYLNIMNVVRLLIYVNSAGNPIIYSLVSTKFRRAFARVLYRMGICKPSFQSPGTNSEENGTLRRTMVSHYSSVRRDMDEGPVDAV
ncbi:hypothetical protein ACOMHN_022637 [Nucella lapillus]